MKIPSRDGKDYTIHEILDLIKQAIISQKWPEQLLLFSQLIDIKKQELVMKFDSICKLNSIEIELPSPLQVHV